MRIPLSLLLAGTLASHAQTVLFRDTFNRPDNNNIDAVLTGITDNTGSSLAADAVYTQAFLDPNSRSPIYGAPDTDASNGGGSRILSNFFQVKYGAGTANAFVNHNFINPSIPAAGNFTVSVDVTAYNQATTGQGGAFGVGMTLAEAQSMGEAVSSGVPHMSNAFGSGQTGAVADFWVALRGNSTVVWGKRDTTLGSAPVAAKTGTISAKFTVPDFNAGTSVGFEVLYGTTSLSNGTFAWTDTNANYIALEGRDNTSVGLDNFTISTVTVPPAATLAVSPPTVPPTTTSQPVTLTWNVVGIPAGSTYQVSTDKAVTFPGGNTGAAANGAGTLNAIVDGTLGDTTFTFTISDSTPAIITTATGVVQAVAERPNVIVMLVDDMGWGDLGCYGSEIPTPNIDNLAATGVRFRQFYNSARCSPTRISLMSGLYPQQGAVDPAAALPDLRTDNNVTMAELLGSNGYRTYMAGKWHLGSNERLPENRGFNHAWRFANGGAHSTSQWAQGNYTLVSQNNEIAFRNYTANGQQFYQTDAIGDYAVDYISHNIAKNDNKPFAMYLAFGAPHFPIQAPAAMADAWTSTYSQGWQVIREQRYNRQLGMGVIDSRYPFPSLGGTGPHGGEPVEAIPDWETLSANQRADSTRRMSLYAAMIQKIDENVGKVVNKLQQTGKLDNTFIMFVSDNGANMEGGKFGGNLLTGAALTNMGQPSPGDNISYGGGWAHMSNTPLKLFKHFTHEGGIRAPAIMHWPAGITAHNTWVESPAHLIDVVATVKEVTGVPYPATFASHPVLPLEGVSQIPAANGQVTAERPLFVEHESNRMIRKGRWKLVTEAFTAFDSEFTSHQKLLYDMDADPGETTNLAASNPAKVVELTDEWNAWSTRVGLPVGRLMVPAPQNITPGTTSADLFVDSFNRAPSNNIDAENTGMWGSRVPPLGTGITWFEGFEGSGAGSIQTIDNILQMATGVGMAESGINHNFTGQDIANAGGFAISLDILNIQTQLDDLPNRFAGFGVGLNATQAAGGNDIGTANPPPIRGNTGNPGTADCFVELDLNGNVKLWVDGAMIASAPVGKNKGNLAASFACNSFAAGATVTVSVYFDGVRLDMNTASASMDRTFTWDEANANHIALSARASELVQMDNLAIRKLPLAYTLASRYAIAAGLDATSADLSANPDGDRLDNFGEWAFGTNPTRADEEVAATSLVLTQPASGIFRFAFRRLTGFTTAGISYKYLVSTDLINWHEAAATEESANPLAASPGYEAVTVALAPAEVPANGKVFLKIAASP